MKVRLITSAENPIFKKVASLKKRKYRDELGLYIIEGEKTVREAAAMGRIKTLIVKEGFDEALDYEVEDTVFMPPKLLKKLQLTDTPQRLVAIAEKAEASVEDIVESASKLVIIDRVQDPGNVGTIIRTAAAAGFEGVIYMKGTVDPYCPKAVRAASGTLLNLKIGCQNDVLELCKMVSGRGISIVVTHPQAEIPYHEADLNSDTALVIGNEGEGVCNDFIICADKIISIPMKKGVESLNVAVAAGILMYESIERNL